MARNVRKGNSKKSRAPLIITLTITTLILLPVSFFFLASTIPGSAKPYIDEANKFIPKDDWVLAEEIIKPPRLICFDGTCGSVFRRWYISKFLSKNELKEMIRSSGWNFDIRGECSPNLSTNNMICSASGRINNYDVTIYQNHSHIGVGPDIIGELVISVH